MLKRCAVLLLGLGLGLSARAEGVDDFLQGLHSLRTNFVQKLLDERGNLVEESEGVLELRRPDHFRWEYRRPYQQVIVADGQEVWIYEADLAQVTRKDYAGAVADSPALVLTGARPLAEVFTVTPLAGSDTAYELLPKNSDSQFRVIRLGLAGGQLESLTLEDNLGQTTFIAFSAQERNIELEDGRFVFVPPDGTDIIDDRE